MNRRSFLAASALAGLSGRLAGAGTNDAAETFVTSEIGPLKRVLVHPPGQETRKAFPMFFGGHSMLTWELLREEAAVQHQAFVKCLREAGAEVLFFENLLNEAIARARSAGVFEKWLKDEAPHLAAAEKQVSAASLLGGDDKFVYLRDQSGAFRPLAAPVTTLFFTRDAAVMTPKGIVICNFNNLRRAPEATLAKFLFQHSPSLQKYPIVFDAIKEQVYIQGGDVLVMDEKTLLLGVGNTTQERAAALLAKSLHMDVVTVQLPRGDGQSAWEGLHSLFYHLDFLVNFVDRKKVLAVPYLLEAKHVKKNPLLDVLVGFARIENLDRLDRVNLLDDVRSVGWIKRYQAGSGERDAKLGEVKLLDFLKDDGYEICYVGGDRQPRENELKHVIERVMHECRFMGANVVATKPAHVISYDGLTGTQAALSKMGAKVTTFPSGELVRANGGPHCLTMPLERGQV